jgi:hypothetical protein
LFQVVRYLIGMSAMPYAMPLRILQRGESFIVEDAGGIRLAYVYFEDEPTRRALVRRLRRDDAKAIAQAIARALTAH